VTEPIIGSWVAAQTSAIASSSHRVCTRAIGNKSADYSQNRKHEEEARPDQSELPRGQAHLLHHRNPGEPDDRLVAEIQRHKQEQEADDQPGFPLLSHLDVLPLSITAATPRGRLNRREWRRTAYDPWNTGWRFSRKAR
jgi:hypothetical protein